MFPGSWAEEPLTDQQPLQGRQMVPVQAPRGLQAYLNPWELRPHSQVDIKNIYTHLIFDGMLRESKMQREIFHWKEWNFLYKDYHCQSVAIAFFFHGTPRGAACISWVPESNLRIGGLIETPKNQSAMTSSPKKWSNWETQILFSTDHFGKFKQPVGVCPLPTLPGDFQTKLLPWAPPGAYVTQLRLQLRLPPVALEWWSFVTGAPWNFGRSREGLWPRVRKTLPETNIFAPENGWLEYSSPFLGPGYF